MSLELSAVYPALDREVVTPPLTFQPMMGAAGPSSENWLHYLIYIRGAAAALKFDDVDLTDRMRRGYDTDEEALETVHAWAETERRLAAAIEILRAAQARCTLAVSRVGTRIAHRAEAEKTMALVPKA